MAYHLVSIGISNYAQPNFHNLSYPADDASDFSELIRQNIQPLDLDILLRDNEASLIGIRTALDSKKLKAATSDDTLILFYSGHGGASTNSNGDYEAFLIPFDGTDDMDISGISTSELQTALDSFNHGKKIVLLDCCYSGGASAKSVSNIKYKDMTNMKAFQNQEYSEGTFVFTACKEGEQAIEVDSLKHGLFTYHLLEEMMRDRNGSNVAMSDLCHPVIEQVIAGAKKERHVQTPTVKMNTQGSVTLPPIKPPRSIKPTTIKVPTAGIQTEGVITPPQINIADKQISELVNQTLALVDQAENSRLSTVAFRSHAQKIIGSVHQNYLEQPKHVNTLEELSNIINELEASAYQLFVTSAAVALVGEDKALRIFNQNIISILSWKNRQSGTVAAIEANDVILVNILYIFTIVSIYSDNYGPLNKLLRTVYTDDYRNKAYKFIDYYQIHYADALGGDARSVFKHVIQLIKTQTWMQEMLGLNEAKLENLVMQSNLLLSVLLTQKVEPIYPSFGAYYPDRVAPFADMVTHDAETQAQLSTLFECKPEEIRHIFATNVYKFTRQGTPGVFWDSITAERFLEDDESIEPQTGKVISGQKTSR